jgi:hypothetical protein
MEEGLTRKVAHLLRSLCLRQKLVLSHVRNLLLSTASFTAMKRASARTNESTKKEREGPDMSRRQGRKISIRAAGACLCVGVGRSACAQTR